MKQLTNAVKKASIFITMLGAISIIIILYILSPKPNESKNGFRRNILTNVLSIEHAIKNENRITNIAGSDRDSIYFQTKIPGQIIITNRNLSEVGKIQMSFNQKVPSLKNSLMEIKAPNVFLYSGNVPEICIGNLISKYFNCYLYPQFSFTRAVALSNDNFVIRGLDETIKMDQTFQKIKPITRQTLAKQVDAFPHKNDAGISSDGLLQYDRESALLLYVPFYKNTVVCMDTTLKLRRFFSTIDTVTDMQITTDQIALGGSRKSTTNNEPLRFVNLRSAVFDGYLYNASALKADNETDEFFSNSVVDVYKIDIGRYLGSFYIPYYNKEKPISFRVHDKHLIVVYPNTIVIFILHNLTS